MYDDYIGAQRPLNNVDLQPTDVRFYRNDNRLISEAIDRLVVKVHHHKRETGRKSILLTSCGSANGTTTIAINLAIALSLSGWNTLLVDLDFRKGNMYKHVVRSANKGLSSFISSSEDLSSITCCTNYEKLHFVPSGGMNKSAVPLLCSEKMGFFMRETKKMYDFVIYDCPSITVVPDASVILPAVDGVALVCSLRNTTKKQLSDARYIMDDLGEQYYGLIVNNVDEWQYKNFYPQHDYFDEKILTKKHRKWLKPKQTKR